LIDFGRGSIVAYAELLDEILADTREDAEALNCVKEVGRAREIIGRGTSAHRQLRIYREACDGGLPPGEALSKVVDWLREETLRC